MGRLLEVVADSEGASYAAVGPRGHEVGARETLLRWLETSLGLQGPPQPRTDRIAAFSARLAAANGASYRASLATDRWGTASALLDRRDALRLAGWDGRDAPTLPALVRDLARAEPGPPGEAERLANVLAALDAGQRLPAHTVVLEDPAAAWPLAWRPVLAWLSTRLPPPATSLGTGSLATAQALVAGAAATLHPDGTLRVAAARSRVAACQALAALLAAEPAALPSTVLVCEDADTALLLDGALARLGVPTVGAARRSAALPPLQVLPLALALCWEPVDPGLLQQFLTLPDTPVPRGAGRSLAWALSNQPGLDSASWRAAWADLTKPEADPDGEVAKQLTKWLRHDRVPRGQPLPTRIVAERCAKVASWAMGRAARLEKEEREPTLAETFRAAAAQAKAFEALATAQGEELSEPQLERLLDAIRGTGATLAPRPAQAQGPTLVRSLAEVRAPCARLVWLGLGTSDPPTTPWSPTELRQLRAAGVEVDDGVMALRRLRAAERRGLARVRERLLVVRVPEDRQRRLHPLWLQLAAGLPKGFEPVYFEDTPGTLDLAPWSLRACEHALQSPQPKRPTWNVRPELLVPPPKASAKELEMRLGCPLKWALYYPARLKEGGSLRIPEEPKLLGTFAHDVFRRVLGEGQVLPTVEAARARAEDVFEERLPLDAAPLAQPAKRAAAAVLKAQVLFAVEQFVKVLHAGGYHVVAMEAPVQGALLGRPMNGSMDCVVATPDGDEGIIDIKLRGSTKYKELLKEGHAVQLAVYAAAREAETQRPVHGVGYLIIDRARLHTPSGSPLRGVEWIQPGIGLQETWANFVAAMQAAEAWLRDGVVPARPLTPSTLWPVGSRMVLGTSFNGDLEPCAYCSYKGLCGKEARA